MKKIIAIILIIILIISLSGCSATKQELLYDRFIIIDGNSLNRLYIAYDKDTKVMYYIVPSCGGICPIYNKDGSILIYEGEAP